MTTTSYQISIPEPHTHIVEARMCFRTASATTCVALPSWTPGSYLMREFGRHIEGLTATVDGEAAEAVQEGKAQWRLHFRHNGV